MDTGLAKDMNIRIWLLWLCGFYIVWFWLVFGLGQWPTAVAHWRIALTMVLGGYVAGSTPMGGGTVGFPVLVLLFGMPASLGRDFSFAIQSIGMTSASIFIFARRQPIAVPVFKGALIGSLVGTPIGILYISPLVPGLWIKVLFAVLWAGFGIFHLYRSSEISAYAGMTEIDDRWNFKLGIALGCLSGCTIVAVTGVGIDMVIYAALVLLCRADLKIAIPTSVVIMAFSSVLGVAVKLLTTGLEPAVYGYWLAAAPVVAIGAPLGALVVDLIGRKPTLLFVAVLCIWQFVWMCIKEHALLGSTGVFVSVIGVGVFLVGFEILRSLGGMLIERPVPSVFAIPRKSAEADARSTP